MKANLIKSTLAALGLALALIIAPSQIAQAAEFTVTDASAVLWTNDSTALCSDADITTTVVPVVEAGLPVAVTGVTSNGYWRIEVGGTTWYVAGIGLSADTSTTTTDTTATATTSSTGWTQEAVYNAIMALQSKYLEGMPWSDQDYTYTEIYRGGGCYGIAGQILTDVFGDNVEWLLKNGMASSISELKVGDVVFYEPYAGGYHVVVVLTIENGYITVVEGNYNGTVHWGRQISESQLLMAYDDDGTAYNAGYITYNTAY